MRIRNNDDLRTAWERLTMWNGFRGYAMKTGLIDTAPADRQIKMLKRSIREYNRQQDENMENRRIVKSNDDGSGYIELRRLPVSAISDAESVNEYFRACYVIPEFNSQYDCTGKPFTVWYKLFIRYDYWYAYHYIGFDV